MDNAKFFETVIRLDATVSQLVPTVAELTKEVKSLSTRQHYWDGAVAAVAFVGSIVGAVGALVFQWLTK